MIHTARTLKAVCVMEMVNALADPLIRGISTKVVTGVRDPKDLYLLSFAQEITADYIVSGDKDLTDLGCFQQTKILKLAEFKNIFSFS